jgi:hypothetical protein
MGLLHVRVLQALRQERGQGTVEYVGVMLLLASVLAAVVAAAKGKDFALTQTITGEIKDAIASVGKK